MKCVLTPRGIKRSIYRIFDKTIVSHVSSDINSITQAEVAQNLVKKSINPSDQNNIPGNERDFPKFYSKNLKVFRTTKFHQKPPLNPNIEFGVHMSDHMMEIDYADGEWGRPVISEFHNLSLDPTNSTFHYAISLFEGLKAVKDKDGNIRLFRPMAHLNRLLKSSERLCLPPFDPEELLKCVAQLLKVDQDWIPDKVGYSLYVRNCFMSMTNILGVLPPKSAKLFTICTLNGPYFKYGIKPMKMTTSEDKIRAWPGGFGHAKLGANYAPTLNYYQTVNNDDGSQVLWLLHDIVTEVGAQNFFVYWVNSKGKEELITCPADGTILPGIMRDTVIKQAREWKVEVSEKHFTIQELIEAIKEGRVLECFGTGTASVISPFSQIKHQGKTYTIFEGGNLGTLSQRLYYHILNIQYGVIPSEWSVKI